MSRRNPNSKPEIQPAATADPALTRRRKLSETLASIGMLLIAVGLVFPLFNLLDPDVISLFKWVFTVGSLTYLAARCIKTSAPADSIKLRRLRHMEFWAGMCFVVASGLWFYNQYKHADTMYVGPLAILRDTILFALAGAVIQLIATWMIYFYEKKARRDALAQPDEKK